MIQYSAIDVSCCVTNARGFNFIAGVNRGSESVWMISNQIQAREDCHRTDICTNEIEAEKHVYSYKSLLGNV